MFHRIILVLTDESETSEKFRLLGKCFAFEPPRWWLTATNHRQPWPAWHALGNPVWWLFWFGVFTFKWVVSRPYRNVGPTIPVVALVGLFFLISWSINAGESSWRTANYRKIALAADDAFSPQTFEIAYRRLIARHPQDPQHVRGLAALFASQGDNQRARGWLEPLVNETRDAEAALWLASDVWASNDLPLSDTQRAQRYREMLEIAATSQEQDTRNEARQRLAHYLESNRSYSDALAIREALARDDPKFALSAAVSLMSSGDAINASNFARQAETHYRAQLETAPLDVDARLNLVRAVQLQGGDYFEQTLQLLDEGWQSTRDRRLQVAQSQVAIAWSRELARKPQTVELVARRLLLTKFALERTPDDVNTINALSQLMIDSRHITGGDLNRLRVQTLELLDPPVASFIRGTLALHAGDNVTAVAVLESAVQQGFNHPGVYNNLAMAHLSADAPQLSKALELAARANQLDPNNPYFIDTLGRVLLRMQRLEEAIAAFEIVMRQEELRAGALECLAEAHQNLGNNAIADEYRRLITIQPSEIADSTE